MAKSFEIESEFYAAGLHCVVIAQDMGFRCGYVAVPEGHPWYNLDCKYLEDVDVHGGVTYSGFGHPIDSGEFFIGFDCAHSGDANDPKILVDSKITADSERFHLPGSHIWTKGEVIQETTRLAQQVRDNG